MNSITCLQELIQSQKNKILFSFIHLLVEMSAVVLVLGDIGRSPRMCNHAVSLATQAEMKVDVVGYNGR